MNPYPVQVRAQPDTPGRWLWLVKWLLLIPHYIVLAVLWLAFIALTVIAYVTVLFTGEYPRAIFAFNVGVLRWNWRVGYYGYQVLGTDRYPPFSLAEVDGYPAGLRVQYPPRLQRWRPLVSWLLALPHLLILAALVGAGSWQLRRGGGTGTSTPAGLLQISLLIGAVALLVTGRYPRGLYDLLVGIVRWSLRVTAYVALLTAAYPPFRLDQGIHEPDGPDGPETPQPPPAAPGWPGGPPGWAPEEAPGGERPAGGAAVAGRAVALVAGVALLLGGAGTAIGGVAVLTVNSGPNLVGPGWGLLATSLLPLGVGLALTWFGAVGLGRNAPPDG